MQIVQKIYIECQEMVGMKIQKGHFWFQSKKYIIENGEIKQEQPNEVIDD